MSFTKQNSNQRFESTPTFDARGNALIDTLSGNIQRDTGSSAQGQYFTQALQRGLGTDPSNLIQSVRDTSDASLPQELAAARSFTRNRPDTFGEQTAMNVTQDNRIRRDMEINNLLLNQANASEMYRGQAAGQLAGMESDRFGQGAALLSLLRGEKGYGRESGTRAGITPK